MILELNTVVPRLAGGELFPNKFDRVPRWGLKKIAERPPRIESRKARASVRCGGQAWDVELCHGFHGEHHGNRTRRAAVTSNRR